MDSTIGKMRVEDSIEKFLDSFDVNTKAYNVLLFILGLLIAMTLLMNQRIRRDRQMEMSITTESTIIRSSRN